MPIEMTCPGCNALFKLPEDLAGQEVRCQKCSAKFVVPLPPSFIADEKPDPAMPPPRPAPRESVRGPIALAAVFVLSLLACGVFAVVWIVSDLGPPIQAAPAPPIRRVAENKKKDDRIANDRVPVKDRFKDERFLDKDRGPLDKGIGKDNPFFIDKGMFKDERFLDKKADRQALIPAQIFIGFGGRAFVNSRIDEPPFVEHGKWNKDGPYRLHKMQLQQGKTYNFHLSSRDMTPRLRVFDGEDKVAEAGFGLNVGFFGNRQVMLAFQPKRTGDHFIWITAEERFQGSFSMAIAPEIRPIPIAADLTEKTSYTHAGQLRIEDPLEISPKNFGPYREYDITLDADKDYNITVVNNQFNANLIPVVQIHEDKRVIEHVGVDRQFEFNDRRVSVAYRPPNTGKYRLRVTSKDFSLGDYTLTISTKGVNVQTILAALNDNSSYTDQRELAASDPKLGTRGNFKAYLITLEQGKKYRIEMTLKDAPTSVLLFDTNEQKVGDVTDAPLVFTAQRTGVHRLYVAAPLPKARQPYTLRITTEP